MANIGGGTNLCWLRSCYGLECVFKWTVQERQGVMQDCRTAMAEGLMVAGTEDEGLQGCTMAPLADAVCLVHCKAAQMARCMHFLRATNTYLTF